MLAVHKNNSQVNIIVLQFNKLVHYYINHWYNTDTVACNCIFVFDFKSLLHYNNIDKWIYSLVHKTTVYNNMIVLQISEL